jgi:hypothetical protein
MHEHRHARWKAGRFVLAAGIAAGRVGATGALVVGWSVLPQRSRLGSARTMFKTEGDVALNGWIKISNRRRHHHRHAAQ